jgi:hypothetical protein
MVNNVSGVFQGGEKRIDLRLVMVFIAINFIVMVNAVIHNPEMGYDAEGHLDYMTTLPAKLPSFEESTEFFSPPLPYFLPSLAYQGCYQIYADENIVDTRNFDCRKMAGKVAQGINVLLSLGTTYLFLLIADRLRPGKTNFKLVGLGLFGLLTVYYKTFAQVRGEPYVAFFCLLAVFFLMALFQEKRLSWKNAIGFGLILGFLILSRQWGFLAFPGILAWVGLVWLHDRPLGLRLGKFMGLSFAVSLVVGGWFYLYLYSNYGSFTAFNQERQSFSFSNKPHSFYRSTGLADQQLFKDPLRPRFDNQFLPSLYSDLWGDYWGFFVYIRDNSYLGSVGLGNRTEMAPYLGRVNLAAVIPSLVFLGGALMGIGSLAKAIFQPHKADYRALFDSLLLLVMLFSFAGFLYFVITVPNAVQGDTVKATYMIQLFVLLPLLGAEFMDRIAPRFPRLHTLIAISLTLVFIHNLPAMVSRYF